MIAIGEFFLDKDTSILYNSQHQEVNVESKSMQVLIYLLAHNERYVTLSELHDNVWNGRIVSDSAVRQTISKLRKLLNDNGEEPKIIRSVIKKGYRFIYPHDEVFPSIDNAADDSPPITNKTGNYLFLPISGVIICTIIFLAIFGRVSVTESFTLNSGPNTGITFNANGEKIYVAKSLTGGKDQLLMALENRTTTLMESEHALLFPVVTTSQQIWVAWQGENKCGLYSISSEGKVEQPIDNITNKCQTISHLSVQGNNILLSAKPDVNSPFQTYVINTTNLFSSVLPASKKSYDPLIAAQSANEKWLAIVTKKPQQDLLSVYDSVTDQVLGQWLFTSPVLQLRWQSNKIYILTHNSLTYVDLNTLEKRSLFKSHKKGQFNRLVDVWVNSNNTYVLQEKQAVTSTSYLTNYHLTTINQLIHHQSFYFESGSLTFSGDTPTTTYYSRINDEKYEILQLTKADLIFSSDQKLTIINYDSQDKELLFTEGDNLVLLDVNTLKIKSKTRIEFTVKGMFKHPKKTVYWFTSYSELGWQTLSWDYSTNKLSQIAINELARFLHNGNVVWLDANDRKIKTIKDNAVITLSDSIPIYTHSQWAYVNDNLWFSQSLPTGASLLKISARDQWAVKNMFKADHIDHVSIAKKDVYIQARKNNISELIDVYLYSL